MSENAAKQESEVEPGPEGSSKPFRLSPRVDEENEHFWKGGAEGELRFLCCDECQSYVHPPAPLCPDCHSRALSPRAVSGRATLHTYTINHHPWIPGFDPPYAVAIVELPEQAGLRLTTNIVHCELDDIEIGMALRVTFEAMEEGVFLPLFEPDLGSDGDPSNSGSELK